MPGANPPTRTDIAEPKDGTLIYRQSRWTRLTHWLWAISLFFMLLSGLQIFNARPQLYIGKQSGFGYNNTIFAIGAENTNAGPRGYTEIFGKRFDTTGVLGWSGPAGQETSRGFPSWATIPSYYDLGTARVVHFFFAWVLTTTLIVWLVASLATAMCAAISLRASTISGDCRGTSSTMPN